MTPSRRDFVQHASVVALAAACWFAGTPAFLPAQQPAANRLYEAVVRFEVTHLDINANAKPVPVETAAAVHGMEIIRQATSLEWRREMDRRLRNEGNIEKTSKTLEPLVGVNADQKLIQAIDEDIRKRVDAVGKPSAKAANITEVEIRFRCADPVDCVTTAKLAIEKHEQNLNEPMPDIDAVIQKREDDFARTFAGFEKDGERLRRQGFARRVDEELGRLKDAHRVELGFLELKKRVGRFVVKIVEAPEKGVEVRTK